jgi:protein-tyrosine-phosphatase
MNVLFVCSGNICRSPMAAACLRDRAARHGPRGLVVDSAGLLGITGAPASPPAIAALDELGLDLSTHRSRGVAPADALRFGLVVAMTASHVSELRRLWPERRGEIVLLRAFEHGPTPDPRAPDLADPIGMPIEFYRERVAEIVRSVEHLAQALATRDGPP